MRPSKCDTKLLGKASGGFLLFLFSSGALFLSRGSTLLIVSQLRDKEVTRCVDADKCRSEARFGSYIYDAARCWMGGGRLRQGQLGI